MDEPHPDSTLPSAVDERVLLVEDDPSIREVAAIGLKGAGFRVTTSGDGRDGLMRARRDPFDVVLLDVMLPGIDGFEVCRRIRANADTSAVPIIMLTAKADEVDRVVGLELGADDYLVKPFSPKELVARVRAVLRRTQRRPTDAPLKVGAISLDVSRHRVDVGGTAIALAPREFALLQVLLESPGRVLTREQLLSRAWGYARADEIESRTVDVHVRRLRTKLGDEGRRIGTVKGIGYQLEAD